MLRSNQQTPEVDRVLGFLTSYIRAANLELTFQCSFDDAADSATGQLDSQPTLHIDFAGPDVPLLLDRRAELLNALEHLAAKLLGLDPEQHHRIRLDAGNHKADRDRELEASFTSAIAEVQRTGHPFRFAPMNSRERRMLHLRAAATGLRSASAGEGSLRSVTISPLTPAPSSAQLTATAAAPQRPVSPDRAAKLREAFRRR